MAGRPCREEDNPGLAPAVKSWRLADILIWMPRPEMNGFFLCVGLGHTPTRRQGPRYSCQAGAGVTVSWEWRLIHSWEWRFGRPVYARSNGTDSPQRGVYPARGSSIGQPHFVMESGDGDPSLRRNRCPSDSERVPGGGDGDCFGALLSGADRRSAATVSTSTTPAQTTPPSPKHLRGYSGPGTKQRPSVTRPQLRGPTRQRPVPPSRAPTATTGQQHTQSRANPRGTHPNGANTSPRAGKQRRPRSRERPAPGRQTPGH